MAKKSLIQREKKRQKLEQKYHLIRQSLKKKIRSKVSPLSLSEKTKIRGFEGGEDERLSCNASAAGRENREACPAELREIGLGFSFSQRKRDPVGQYKHNVGPVC